MSSKKRILEESSDEMEFELPEMEIVPPPPKRKKDPRFQGKNWALTYPRVHKSCDAESTLEQIKLWFEDNLEWAVVAVEKHKPKEDSDDEEENEDYQRHFHIAIALKQKVKMYGENFKLFVIDEDGNSYQPNIQTMRNKSDWINYISKDGGIVFNF